MSERVFIPIKLNSVMPKRIVVLDTEAQRATIHCCAHDDVITKSIHIPLQDGWDGETGATVENLIEVALAELQYKAPKDENGNIIPGDEVVDHLKSALNILITRAGRKN